MTKKDSVLLAVLSIATVISVTATYKLSILLQHLGNVDFSTLGKVLCGEESPSFLWVFDLSSAPGLLFYAYMPMAAISTFFVMLLLQRKYRSQQRNRLLAVVLSFFVLWILCILVQWLASYHIVLLLAWQLIVVFETGLYLSAFYFAYVYINDKDLPFWAKVVLTLISLVVLGLTPTTYNILSYRPQSCAGTEGLMWTVLYFVVEPALIAAILSSGLNAFRYEKNRERRAHIALFTVSFVFFMTLFAVANFFGELTTAYELNFWGPLGLLLALLMAGYMAMTRLAFHWQTVVAQLLVWGLVTLIGAEFFYISSTTQFILNSATFLATLVFGILMIRSITVEIRQKDAEAALMRQRESLGRLVTKKMKDLLTRGKFIVTELTDGSSRNPEEMRVIAQRGTAFSDEGLAAISEVQNAASLKNKTVALDRDAVNFRSIVFSVVDENKESAEKKGLKLATEMEDGNFMMLGDALWLKKMANVFVDNAVKYTDTGTITIGLQRQAGSALFWVRDTGIGISEDDKSLLFTEGGHGQNSPNINPDSIGFGLFIAKLVIDAHSGRAYVESAEGKGTTFFVELPLLS